MKRKSGEIGRSCGRLLSEFRNLVGTSDDQVFSWQDTRILLDDDCLRTVSPGCSWFCFDWKIRSHEDLKTSWLLLNDTDKHWKGFDWGLTVQTFSLLFIRKVFLGFGFNCDFYEKRIKAFWVASRARSWPPALSFAIACQAVCFHQY